MFLKHIGDQSVRGSSSSSIYDVHLLTVHLKAFSMVPGCMVYVVWYVVYGMWCMVWNAVRESRLPLSDNAVEDLVQAPSLPFPPPAAGGGVRKVTRLKEIFNVIAGKR